MPTITTTVTSGAASGATTTITTTEAIAERPLTQVATSETATKYSPPTVWTNDSPSGGKFASTNAPTAGARFTEVLEVGKHPIQLHSLGTPNGVKVTIMLEELCEVSFANRSCVQCAPYIL